MYVSELSSFYLGTVLQSLRPWIWRTWANISSLCSWKSHFNFSKLLFNKSGGCKNACGVAASMTQPSPGLSMTQHEELLLVSLFPANQHPIGWVAERAGGPALLLSLCCCVDIRQFSFQVPLLAGCGPSHLQTCTPWRWLSSEGQTDSAFPSYPQLLP